MHSLLRDILGIIWNTEYFSRETSVTQKPLKTGIGNHYTSRYRIEFYIQLFNNREHVSIEKIDFRDFENCYVGQ